MRGLVALPLLALLVSGCNQQAAEPTAQAVKAAPAVTTAAESLSETEVHKMPDNPQSLPVADQHTRAELTQRYAEIKTMIGEAKASDVQQCRKVAFGYKACGGPASYLIYSVAGLDEALLLKKVAEYNALDAAETHRLGLISDCAMVTEPGVILEGGVCKAGPAGDLY